MKLPLLAAGLFAAVTFMVAIFAITMAWCMQYADEELGFTALGSIGFGVVVGLTILAAGLYICFIVFRRMRRMVLKGVSSR